MTAPAASSVALPIAQTAAQIIANLLQQNPAPTPYALTWTPSTDAATFMTDDYDKQGNLSMIMGQINHENGLRSSEYQLALQNWAAGGMQGQPPAAPHYESFDMSDYDKWWDATTAGVQAGIGAPDVSTFVENMKPDAGYL